MVTYIYIYIFMKADSWVKVINYQDDPLHYVNDSKFREDFESSLRKKLTDFP